MRPLRSRLQSYLAWSLYWSDDPERRATLTDAALVNARRENDPATLGYVLYQHYRTLTSLRRYDALLGVADEMMQIGEQLQNAELIEQGHLGRVSALLEGGDIGGAEAALDAHARLVEEMRLPVWQMMNLRWRAVWRLLDGRLDESEALVQDVLTLWRRSMRTGHPWLLLHLVALRRAQGRLAEIEADVLEMAALQPAPVIQALPSYLHSLVGEKTVARREFDALAANDFATFLGSSYPINVVTYLAETCAALRDRERAPALYRLLHPFAGRHVAAAPWPQFRGAVDHYLGLLSSTTGEWDVATRPLLHTSASTTSNGAPLSAHPCRLRIPLLTSPRIPAHQDGNATRRHNTLLIARRDIRGDGEKTMDVDLSSDRTSIDHRMERSHIAALSATVTVLALTIAIVGTWTWQSAGTDRPTNVTDEVASNAHIPTRETHQQSLQRAGVTDTGETDTVYLLSSQPERELLDDLLHMHTEAIDTLNGITLAEIIRALHHIPASTDIALIDGATDDAEHLLRMLYETESIRVAQGLPGIRVIDLRAP